MRINTCQDGIYFSTIIQSRLSKNEVTGIYKDAIKIRLTALPVHGAANKSSLSFFSKWLEVALRKSVLQEDIAVKIKSLKLLAFQKIISSKF